MAHVNVRSLSDLSADELRSLADWLSATAELRGHISLFERVTESEHMGGILEAVTIAVSSGGAATVLIRSLFTWLTQRQRGATLRLDLTKPDGQETHLEIDGIQDPDGVIDKVLKFLDDDQ